MQFVDVVCGWEDLKRTRCDFSGVLAVDLMSDIVSIEEFALQLP